MNVVIVFESMFGNTRRIAEAMAEGIGTADPGVHVSLLPLPEASPDYVATADLLVVGGPTHMFGMSRTTSRAQAPAIADKARAAGHPTDVEWAADAPGVREWLAALSHRPKGAYAAAYDTRMRFQKVGGAAPRIAHALRRHGYHLVARPTGFVVDRGEGPLSEGELDRARAWAAHLLARCPRLVAS